MLVLEPDTAGFIGRATVVLVIPAPLRCKTLKITGRLLLTTYAPYINKWQMIMKADFDRLTGASEVGFRCVAAGRLGDKWNPNETAELFRPE
jgi:hypothetical protein